MNKNYELQPQRMTSPEIAKVTGKRHKDVVKGWLPRCSAE